MDINDIFRILWKQYETNNPSVKKIHELFASEGETIVNDHIAFRTFNDPRVGVDVLARPFIKAGYVEKGQYRFEEKKLFAKHFEKEGYPRVFISELLLEEFSPELRGIVDTYINEIPVDILESETLIVAGNVNLPVSYEVYETLRSESEYAAWLYAHGYCANHFTVSVNHLQKYSSMEKLNAFIKLNGFQLNASGGEIKGTQEQLLEQSSTLADKVEKRFKEGLYTIPSCYYEFARRYEDSKGQLFSGFIAGSADKIFESTDFRGT